MTTSIEPVCMADINELITVSRVTFLDTFGTVNSSANINQYLDAHYNEAVLTQELTVPEARTFFIRQDGAVAGYLKVNAGAAQTEAMGDDTLEVQRIYILPNFKRQGLGNQLMDQAITVAQQWQKPKLWLGVWEHNEPALAFYATRGFQAVGDHVFRIGESQQRDLILMKSLEEDV